MMPYNVFGWAALAQESISPTLVLCYSYKCPTMIKPSDSVKYRSFESHSGSQAFPMIASGMSSLDYYALNLDEN
jgi:hypothetical protein